MKSLERPSGYFQTWDPVSGRKLEGETRACVHCRFMWIYNPKESFDRKLAGNPIIRGKCLQCHGQVCAQPDCLAKGCVPYMKDIEEQEAAARAATKILIN